MSLKGLGAVCEKWQKECKEEMYQSKAGGGGGVWHQRALEQFVRQLYEYM